jgi:membrane protein implicated in regulation of membrane protease activity
MDHATLWGVTGLVLVIVELVTGTFYLLMLGIAAFGAALAAWLGFEFSVQTVVAIVVSVVGCWGVHIYKARNRAQQMAPLDAGMPASFERWLDAGERLAKVRYRGASWEARVEGLEAIDPGATVYVLAADGNTLRVAKNKPV